MFNPVSPRGVRAGKDGNILYKHAALHGEPGQPELGTVLAELQLCVGIHPYSRLYVASRDTYTVADREN